MRYKIIQAKKYIYEKLPTSEEKREWVLSDEDIAAANKLCDFLNSRKRGEDELLCN